MPNTLTERVGLSIGRHFVSLSCMQFIPDKPEKPHVFSGFVMAIADEWFYVTAGHILRAVRAALTSGSTFDIWRLGDQTAARGKFNHTARGGRCILASGQAQTRRTNDGCCQNLAQLGIQ